MLEVVQGHVIREHKLMNRVVAKYMIHFRVHN
jgi:hypothetical protein